MKIPGYDNYQESLGNGPRSNVRSQNQPDVAGSQLRSGAQAMSTAGAAVAGIGLDMQRDVNEAKTKQADNAAAELVRQTLQDYTSKLGGDAMGKSAEDARKALDKVIEERVGSLDNDMQKRMFKDVAERRKLSALAQIDEHEQVQAKAFNIGQSSARADQSRRDALDNLDAPELFNRYKATMLSEVAAVARLSGKGDEAQTKELQQKVLGQLHSDAIDTYLAKERGDDARAYYAANKGEIDPSVRPKIEKLLESAGIKETSLKAYLQLKSGSYSDQLVQAEKLYTSGKLNVEAYDGLVQRINAGETQRKAAETERDKQYMGSAQEWILSNPGRPILEMPTQLYDWAKGNGQLATLQNFARTGGDPVTDSNVFYETRMLAADPATRPQFANMDLTSLRPQLSRADFNSLVALQSSVRSSNFKEMEANSTAIRVIKAVTEELGKAGLDVTPGDNPAKNAEMAQFRDAVLREADARTKAKGAPLDDKEVRKLGLDMLKEGRLQGSGIFVDDKARRFQLVEGNKYPFVTTRYKDIAPANREKVEAWVRANWRELRLLPQTGHPDRPMENDSVWRDTVERVYQQLQDQGALE